jgi:hypothetical protein
MSEPGGVPPEVPGPREPQEFQEVDAIPVLLGESLHETAGGELARRGRHGLLGASAPATQAMAVAVGGFVAGAAIVGLTGRRRAKRALTPSRLRGRRARKAGGARGELVRILGTRSLLVDVHLLDSR